MKVKAEFSGGLELIFKGKELEIELELDNTNNKAFTIQDLVLRLKPFIFERPEFFLTNTNEM